MIDSYLTLQSLLFSPDRVPLAMAAILLAGVAGMVTGPLAGQAYPFLFHVVDRLFGGVGARLDRVQRKPGDLMLRGMLLTFVVMVLFWIAGTGAQGVVIRFSFGGWTEIILLSLCLSAGAIWFALLQLFFAMREKKTSKNAYYVLSRTTRTDFSGADDFTLTRVGMALAARGFDKGVVAPVLWYLIGGLPLAFIYCGLAALAWRFGRDGFTKGFGRVALALEQLMGFVPNILAGLLMAAAGLLTPTGGMTRALIGLTRTDRRIPYAEGGLPVSAMADSLHVALNGPSVDLDGRTLKRRWAGPDGATARLDAGHLRRALYITLMAHLLLLAGLGASLLFS